MSTIEQADAERLRLDMAADRADRDRRAAPTGCAPVMVARTTTAKTYPTTAATFFACIPAGVLGAEVEGAAGTVTPASGVFYALNLGSAIPPSGTNIIATFVASRWVFRYDG